jgi:hypothetical protein
VSPLLLIWYTWCLQFLVTWRLWLFLQFVSFTTVLVGQGNDDPSEE